TLEGSVLQVQAISIHGAVFYEVVLQTPQAVRRLRFQDTFLHPGPTTGEHLRIELILGNVHNVQRIADP
ncbi:hypothetical protein, partial [Meiothermus taiwanensis]